MNESINHRVPNSSWVNADNFYRFVLAALILRIFIMPFFGHVDVLSEARRIYFWDQAGIYFDDISRNATSIFQLLFFKVFSVFIENKEMLFQHEDMRHSTAGPVEYFEFVSQPAIYRTLFIIKLPFLAADLITAWALYKYCGSNVGAKRAVVFWLLNPVTIFAFYIFGRFESIPIMFCMLSLLALQRRYLVLSAVMVGLCMNSRELFIFYGPLFIALICSPSYSHFKMRDRVGSIVIVALAAAVSVQMLSLTGGQLDAFGREVQSITTEGRVDYLFKFIVGSYLVFPMAYFFLLLFVWNYSSDQAQNQTSDRFALLDEVTLFAFALVIISFFVFSSHTAHYTSWVMIFPCIYLARQAGGDSFYKPMLLLCVTWIFYNLSITDLGVFTTWLASPWSIHMAGLPNFPRMYEAFGLTQYLDLLTFQRICRTFYTACLWYLAVLMIMQMVRKHRASQQMLG